MKKETARKILYCFNPLLWLVTRGTKKDTDKVIEELDYSFFVGFIYGMTIMVITIIVLSIG
jgi:hypothetical protein